MAAMRTLGGLLILLAAAPLASAQPYTLAEVVKADDCYRYHLDMSLAGELKVNRDGKAVAIKLTAPATHEFPERILKVGDNGLPEKSARVYEKAHAAIGVGDEHSERSLRAERRLMVAQRHQDHYLVYCPAGPLTREELELTSEHFDTLTLTGLLPDRDRAVSVGDNWKPSNAVVQALCGFEGLTEHSLVCKLEEAKDNIARVSVTGTATGIELGALIKLRVEASYRFDLGAKHLIGVEWQQTDDRDQGPASPASSVQTTTKLTRAAIEQPECLNNLAVVVIPDRFDPPASMLELDYRDPKGRFALMHGRDWQTVGQTRDHLILRLVDDGDFVAQVTITPWTAAEKGKHLSADAFKEAMQRTPGWEMEQELQAGEVPVPAGDGRWIYRISALGKMDGTDVMQNFYLVAGPGGEQVVLLFTMTPKKATKLGERDLSMAGSLDFPAEHKDGNKSK
jgi:hypothetical protein